LGEQSLLPALDRQFYRDQHLLVHLRHDLVMLDSRVLPLSRIEYRLLALLVEHAGEIVSRPTLALWVWGRVLGPRSHMLDKHIHGLRQKLGAYADRHIETVYGTGYRFRASDSAPTSGDIKDVPD
jgi:DNA-binding response OmpR family regulator